MDVTGNGSKVPRCKEQHCTGSWNVRSMNQGRLEVVKQQMARVNIDILGIRELKCIGMSELTQMTIISTTIYGQESLRKNGLAIIVNKRVQNAVLGCYLKKRQNYLCSFPRQTIQYNSNPSLCPDQ